MDDETPEAPHLLRPSSCFFAPRVQHAALKRWRGLQ
jgi:hypothetical protein